MTSGLPDNRSMWIRSFYGFSPEEDGYVGVGKMAARDRMLKTMNDGDLIMIYGSDTSHTKKAQRSYILGFLQIDAKPIRDIDKSSPESQKWKIDNGFQHRWTFGIPVRRLACRRVANNSRHRIQILLFKRWTGYLSMGSALGARRDCSGVEDPGERGQCLGGAARGGRGGQIGLRNSLDTVEGFSRIIGHPNCDLWGWRDFPLSGALRRRWPRLGWPVKGFREGSRAGQDRGVQWPSGAVRPTQFRISPGWGWKVGDPSASAIPEQEAGRDGRAIFQGQSRAFGKLGGRVLLG